MKMSVRTKLFVSVGSLIALFVIFSLLLNSLFLGKYYIWQKKHYLMEKKNLINSIYQGYPESIAFELEKIEQNDRINIYFLNQNNQLKNNIIKGYGERVRLEGPNPFLHSMQDKIYSLSKGDSITDVYTDPRLNTNFITLLSRLNNGDILVLTTPIAAINESTAIANRFLLLTGLLIMLLGGMGVYLFAWRFTKPIKDLNDIAQSMSKLDFSKKYPVTTTDEIGQLGSSINSLSDQLDKAIFELKDANQKLMADIEQERRIDGMRKEFISNVSHELKTPISLIQGYAEGLKLNVNEDEENKNFYCDVIMDESFKMNTIVKDLLDLSQIDSGYFTLDRKDFNIAALIDRVLEKYRPVFTEKGVRVAVEKSDGILVNGDVVRIEQVLVNYLNNAINHLDVHKLINIKITDIADKIQVSVFNSGPNIPQDSIDKIWTSFYKVDKARTRAYGGTGLGLSVVKAIMEHHGNSFSVENQKDGVSFWFELNKAH